MTLPMTHQGQCRKILASQYVATLASYQLATVATYCTRVSTRVASKYYQQLVLEYLATVQQYRSQLLYSNKEQALVQYFVQFNCKLTQELFFYCTCMVVRSARVPLILQLRSQYKKGPAVKSRLDVLCHVPYFKKMMQSIQFPWFQANVLVSRSCHRFMIASINDLVS